MLPRSRPGRTARERHRPGPRSSPRFARPGCAPSRLTLSPARHSYCRYVRTYCRYVLTVPGGMTMAATATSTEPQLREVLSAYADAKGAHDVEAALALCTEDCYYESVGLPGRIEG